MSKRKSIDLTLEVDQEANSKSTPKMATEEKRLKRFRSTAPQGVRQRINRALSQRMFLIEETLDKELWRSYKVKWIYLML